MRRAGQHDGADRRADNADDRDGAADSELLDLFLELLAGRLAAGLLERVDRRVSELAAERVDARGGAVSVKEAARRLGLSPRGVARLMNSGELPSLKVGRRRLVPTVALERLLERGSDGATRALVPPPAARKKA